MITLIGTGHVLRLREKIKNRVIEKKPQAVCLQMDKQRYETLLKSGIPLNSFESGEQTWSDIIGAIEGSKGRSGLNAFLLTGALKKR